VLSYHPNNQESSQEIQWLTAYLPQQLSSDALCGVIKNLINSQHCPNIGSIMKALKAEFSGQYDGKLASDIIKQLLS
jgi:uncharacterized protein YqeY